MNRDISKRSKPRKQASKKVRNSASASAQAPHSPQRRVQSTPNSDSASETLHGGESRLKRRRRSRTLSQNMPNNSALALRPKSSRSKVKRQGPLRWAAIPIRILILGVGIAAIAGTALSILVPSSQSFGTNISSPLAALGGFGGASSDLPAKEEMKPLKEKLLKLAAQSPGLTLGCFLLDLDTGGYVDINGSQVFAAASTIKFPLLVAFFQDVDSGRIKLNEKLTLRKDLIAAESGTMQDKKLGTQFSALYTASQMISISDNTATNLILDRLGGPTALNRRFKSWNLNNTVLKNLLPDVEGTNVSTPKDLATLMSRVSQGGGLSLKSRDRLLAIMQTTQTNTLLPQGLGEGAKIAHKTGNIGTMIGDVGLIDMPTGKRYLTTVLVKRPYNDTRAEELVRQVSKTSYEYLINLPQPTISSDKG